MAVGGVLGLSLKGIFAKFAFIAGASVILVVLLRMLLSLPLFWAADRVMRGKGRARLGRRDSLLGLAFGVLFLFAMVCDFAAIDRLGVSLSRIVLFTYPLLVVLVVAAMERRWPSMRQVGAFVIAYAGLMIVLRPDRAGLPEQFWSGVGFAAATAISIAFVYALANPLIKRIGASRFSVLTHLSAAFGMCGLAATSLSVENFAIAAEAYLWIVAVVVFSTVAPILMQYEAMRRIGAARVSLIGLLGPVITVSLAWLLLGERLDAVQLAGFALVLLGIVILEWESLGAAFRERR